MTLLTRLARVHALSILFLVLVPISAHLLFSSLGFNPTDDGFTLAYSRRIIEGQIPHRDFISIRPALSPVLHIPFVLWGGDYTYMASRLFVWFQLACIAWIWVSLLEKGTAARSFSSLEKVSIGLICFAVSAHVFPIMAWHTIDGLFLMSIGCALCLTGNSTTKTIGYLLISLAYLCKQSFIFVAPLTLVVLSDWRNTKYWLAILAPGALYTTLLLITGAMPDGILQLTSQTNIVSTGFGAYFNREALLGVVVGYLCTRLIMGSTPLRLPLSRVSQEWLGLATLAVIPPLYVSWTFVTGTYIYVTSFGVFGLAVGVLGCILLDSVEWRLLQLRVGLLVLIMAWSSSISIGKNTPNLGSGELLALLSAYTYPAIRQKLDKPGSKYVYAGGLLALSVTVIASFGTARTLFIYRDQAAPSLTRKLDAILPGGKGIRTNENTYEFLLNLHEAIRIAQDLGSTYSIIPDGAGWWVKSAQANPLSIDWAWPTELDRPELVLRVTSQLESMRSSNIAIVQKVEAKDLARGFVPLDDKYYAVVEYVRSHFSKIYETSLFELYR